MASNEERLDKLEEQNREFKEALETMSHIIKTSNKQLQRHVIELTDHFAANLDPKIKKIVYSYVDVIRDEQK